MDTQQTQTIQLLPEHIIDQIKAGEVIERPSTLIKEIIENSIDSKATKIDIHIVENALELIHIKDNGNGIVAEQMPLAFCRHATSKIDRFEDIYRLSSFGFRGEALASIASISKVECKSTTELSSGIIRIEAGETLLHEITPSQGEKSGTQIHIRDLFYNTPVRMKFIQSKTAEKNQISKIIKSFLISHPEITFSIKWDQKDKEIYEKTTEEQRLKDVLFKGKSVSLISSSTSYDGIHFKIYLSQESSRGNAHKQQYLFINNRIVQDIQIHKIILNSAKYLWPEGESGHYIAKLFIPKDELDVNVHPNKTVVKLFNPAKTYSVISGTIKSKVQKENPQILTRQNETQYSLSSDEEGFSKESTISYKQVDFSMDENTEDYLKNIHSQNQIFNDSNQYQKTQYIHEGDFIIMVESECLYIIKIQELIETILEQTFKKENFNTESMPLLISKPINLDKKPSKALLKGLQKLGFEFDFLDNHCLVIRAFPAELQHFPYLKILEYLFSAHKKDITFQGISKEIFSEQQIEKFVLQIKTHSTENSLLIRLSNKDLHKLYEAKK